MAHVAVMTVPDAHVMGDARSRRVADGATRDGADRAGHQPAGERPQGGIADPLLRPGSGRDQGEARRQGNGV
jgi:hypothetical protein